MSVVLRTALLVMFCLLAAQSGIVIFYYARAYRRMRALRLPHAGLLPLHVVVVTVLFLAWALEVLVLGRWLFFNTVTFAAANYGLYLVLVYERRRFVPITR